MIRSKLAEQWANLMTIDKGILVIAGVPEGGVTTLTDVSLMETDRLLRDFVSIEEVNHREREMENIEVNTYDESKGESRRHDFAGPDSKVPQRLRAPRS